MRKWKNFFRQLNKAKNYLHTENDSESKTKYRRKEIFDATITLYCTILQSPLLQAARVLDLSRDNKILSC